MTNRKRVWWWSVLGLALAQVAAGVVVWWFAMVPEAGRLGCAVFTSVGGFALLGLATPLFRGLAVVANALLALLALPSCLIMLLNLIDPATVAPQESFILARSLISTSIFLGAIAGAVGSNELLPKGPDRTSNLS